MKFVAFIVFIFSIGTALPDTLSWPNLASFEFTSGRAATEADVEAGRAAFVIKIDGEPAGDPIDIQIPQFAYHITGETKIPVVIIQAESNSGVEAVGYIIIESRAIGAGLLTEFELLGADAPE